jgi:predicted kinase
MIKHEDSPIELTPEVVIFIGLPGAGKTTLYNERFAGTHVHISKDRMKSNRRPELRQQQLLREALVAGHSVVIDNTNPSVATRAPLLQIAREMGARTSAYYFDVPKQICVQRNKQRAGKAKVPDVAIYVTASKLKPPQAEEGFDQEYTVTPGEPQALITRTK